MTTLIKNHTYRLRHTEFPMVENKLVTFIGTSDDGEMSRFELRGGITFHIPTRDLIDLVIVEVK